MIKTHPDYQLAKKQMKSCGGMISFDMYTLEEAKTVVQVGIKYIIEIPIYQSNFYVPAFFL